MSEIPKGYVEVRKGVYAKAGVPVGVEFGAVSKVPDFTPQPSTDESKLNKTEKAWLARRRLLHPGSYIGIQNITLKLADDLRFTPDFSFIDENGRFVLVDTKGGFTREDSWIKIKIAARLFPMFDFEVQKLEKGVWTVRRVRG